MKRDQTVYNLLKESIPHSKLILGIIFSALGSFLTLMIPQIIGQLASSEAIEYLMDHKYIIGLILLFILVLYIIKTVATYFLGTVGATAIENVQKTFSSHVIALPISVIERYQPANLSSRLTNDIVVISKIASVIIPDIIINSVIVIGALIFLFKINLKLTLFVLLIVPIFLLVNLPVNKKLENIYRNQQKLLGDISGNFTQSINNIKLIKSFNAQEDEKKRHFSYFNALSNNMKRMVLVGASLSSLSAALIVYHLTFLVIYLSFTYYKGGLNISDLIIFFMYVVQVISPILQLLNDFTELFEARGAISRLSEILDLNTEDDGIYKDHVTNMNSSIVFENVSFSYGESSILNNLNFIINNKEFVSIVGPSGSGKSTILSLIYKFYGSYEGKITVGGYDLEDISPYDLRNNVSFILQNNLVFSDTIRNNLKYGKNRDLDDDILREYTYLTTIDKFIDKYQGLDTVIGEEGILLSEGQKQKINVARNLLSEPKILLLDEPSSSLDVVSESVINDILVSFKDKMTIVVVAHKIKTVMNSDKIIVLNSLGSIEAIGTHEFLIKNSPTYKQFYNMSLIQKKEF
ncbi:MULTISPECIES: ABC transporter ATP-binding protein [Anaerococcus]|uniref:ABC transporter ATP-binding protein n=1 Tax=Anaerococcus nagyae TaxID=1755241 RepID=A0A3E2TFZ3_9FIRM|nr:MULTISPECIES: ABC transporter ATP-binding protein [Anaerococcus]MDU1828872.1 ABC transporter ATP-binding protein [Anaerococcus sp.]MDU1865002.1 ABC transporter ATP-binding protein [Anaerococcus sp.]MDU2566355.1 ABC transporter ATP-binding protein [Anaerococcus sp.]RGB74892.1 ABC transporter ATP-binding protein [Anaerococcus nagyae]